MNHIFDGPIRVLLDKKGLLAAAVFPRFAPAPEEQVETLRRLVYWFWHDLSHLITALSRGQLWWAYGQMEVLRLMCVNLARLRHNFADAYVKDDDYFKVDLALPVEQLAALKATYCPMEPEAMLQAALAIFSFYKQLAPALAQAHAIPYPAGLERVMVDRLKKLGVAGDIHPNSPFLLR